MRELSAAQSILEAALRHAKQSSARRVTDVNLVVGQLAGLADESIRRAWSEISKDTLAEGAALHIRHVPAKVQCMVCAEKYSPNGEEIRCPNCGSAGVKILSGEEFSVEAVGVEK